MENAHARFYLVAVLHLLHIADGVQHRACPAGSRPIVGVGVADVLALPFVDEHLGLGENVVVLSVVPVGVSHHRDIDVRRSQAPLGESGEQEPPPADVPGVHDDVVVASHQEGAAEAQRPVIGVDGLSMKQNLDRRHAISLSLER